MPVPPPRPNIRSKSFLLTRRRLRATRVISLPLRRPPPSRPSPLCSPHVFRRRTTPTWSLTMRARLLRPCPRPAGGRQSRPALHLEAETRPARVGVWWLLLSLWVRGCRTRLRRRPGTPLGRPSPKLESRMVRLLVESQAVDELRSPKGYGSELVVQSISRSRCREAAKTSQCSPAQKYTLAASMTLETTGQYGHLSCLLTRD